VALVPLREITTPLKGGRSWHVRVVFPDGEVWEGAIPTPERLRKGKVTSAEIGRLLDLRDHFVRRVGHGHFLREYSSKWTRAAIDRQANAHLRVRPKELDQFDNRSDTKDRNIRREHAMFAKVKRDRPDLTSRWARAKEVARRLGRKPGLIYRRLPRK
jgi:hypothetical protein